MTTKEELEERLWARCTQPEYARIQIWVASGWVDLVDGLDKQITELHPDYKIIQIKEKFGGLRFYAQSVSEDAQRLIYEAENKSVFICEECGQSGENRSVKRWFRTECDEHYYERKALREEAW